MKKKLLSMAACAALAAVIMGCSGSADNRAPTPIVQGDITNNKISHIVVLYLENRSFDNLFRGYPGADTSDNPTKPYLMQVDASGNVYSTLPSVPLYDYTTGKYSATALDTRFPASLPNQPFKIDDFVSQALNMPDLVNIFSQNQDQITGGKNDKFALYSDAKALTMGYYDMSKSNLWKLAKSGVLCDNFFMAAFGGSFLNHQWLVAAQSPIFNGADGAKVPTYTLNPDGTTNTDGVLTPASWDPLGANNQYAVNTIQPFSMPYNAAVTDAAKRLPAIPYNATTFNNIGDALTAKGVSWTWYSGGYDIAMAGNGASINYQYHHNPLVYFKNYDVNSTARLSHIQDETALYTAIANGSLPSVTFWKPGAADNQHPGYASVAQADAKVADIVGKIQANATLWPNTVIVITYDENGGQWDHVAPPKVDKWGPGSRIPAIILSPYAKKGFVDHTQYDTTSILKFIETRFGVSPLSSRDKNANNLGNAFTGF